MHRREERELLELTRENNKMLKFIVGYINRLQAHAESENNYDFLRNIIANLVSNRVFLK